MVSNQSRSPKTNPKVPTWILLWGAVILFAGVIVLSNKPLIDQFLVSIGFLNSSAASDIIVEQPPSVVVEAPPAEGNTPLITGNTFGPDLQPLLDEINEDADETATAPEAQVETPLETGDNKSAFTVYFVHAQNDGAIDIVETTRGLNPGNSPLTAAIQALLAGPTPEELSKNILSLIPEGTRLKVARVSGETATLDFSDEFQFNTLGVEGYQAQLRQIIYTTTSFPNIKKVQFLIEGHRVSSLGEGVPIGMPLTRNSF